jgi:flagellar basal body-associated protein FliL
MMRPGRRGYAPGRRGAGWIPALIIILLVVGAGVLAWMFLSNNNDGSTEFSPAPSVASQVT